MISCMHVTEVRKKYVKLVHNYPVNTHALEIKYIKFCHSYTCGTIITSDFTQMDRENRTVVQCYIVKGPL